eukprot:SAG31_NODE_11716_length_1004_cov_0.959116_1_plen_89_part_01
MSLKLAHENTATGVSLAEWETDGSKPPPADDFLDMWLEDTTGKVTDVPSSKNSGKGAPAASSWDWPATTQASPALHEYRNHGKQSDDDS